MSRAWPTITLRLPQKVMDDVRDRAKETRRSINSEYVVLLESALLDAKAEAGRLKGIDDRLVQVEGNTVRLLELLVDVGVSPEDGK